MNILISSAHYHFSDKYGSEAKWAVDIVKNYSELGHNVFVVAGVVELESSLDKKIKIYCLSNNRHSNPLIEVLKKAYYPFFAWRKSHKIYSELKGQIDLVHHIAPISPISYDLFFIFRTRTQTKFVMGPAMPPPIEQESAAFSRVLGTKPSMKVMLLWILIRCFFPILEKLAQLTLRNTDKLYVVSKEAQKFYLNFISKEKISIIPVGISKYNEKKFKRAMGPVKIITVSYLVRRKGLDILLSAIAQLYYHHSIKNFKLEIIGSGEELENLQQLVKQLKIENLVKFIGFIPNEKINNFYQQADIFCSPTRYEPYGISVVEAMANGLPVIVSDVNALPEIIDDAGLIFGSENVDQLALQLKKLISSENLRHQLSKKAISRVEQNFLWRNIVKEYIKEACP